MMNTKSDETLEEIWAIRRKLAKQFNYDPKKASAYYQRKQKELGSKIYRPDAVSGAEVQTSGALHDHAGAGIAAGKRVTPISYRAPQKRRKKRAK